MKKKFKTQGMTKLLLTATLCAALIFGAAACNNTNGNAGGATNTEGSSNVEGDMNSGGNNDAGAGADVEGDGAPAVTDEMTDPTMPAEGEDAVSE
ncbi:hypothetical protein ACX93W_07080 [Paenibacillus sp. CAU 1782]